MRVPRILKTPTELRDLLFRSSGKSSGQSSGQSSGKSSGKSQDPKELDESERPTEMETLEEISTGVLYYLK